MKKGDTYLCKLPKWICNGETVVVTIEKLCKKDFNCYDFEGSYYDKTGKLFQGKFYEKDLKKLLTKQKGGRGTLRAANQKGGK